jgi:hypothetical protein
MKCPDCESNNCIRRWEKSSYGGVWLIESCADCSRYEIVKQGTYEQLFDNEIATQLRELDNIHYETESKWWQLINTAKPKLGE